jgi:hypothetical protein
MHGLVVELEIDETQADRAIEFLHEVAVPMIKKGAGFVGGTWMRSLDGRRTRSVILYEDEATAQAAAQRAAQGPPPGAPTRFVAAEVFEVVAQA